MLPGWVLQQLAPFPDGQPAGGLDINDSGVVLGQHQINYSCGVDEPAACFEPAVWVNGLPSSLPSLNGAVNSSVYAINNAGLAVGWTGVMPSGATSAVSVITAWTPTTAIQLLPAATATGGAFGLNNLGQIVGGLNSGHAFVTTISGAFQDLGVFGGTSAQATAINDSGVIVGLSSTSSSTGVTSRVFVRYPDGSVHFIGLPPGFTSAVNWGVKLNNAGQVLFRATSAGSAPAAFVWRSGTTTPITVPGCMPGIEVMDINSYGQVVGNCTLANGYLAAFIWQDGVSRLLPTPSGSTSRTAHAINNQGDVVGTVTLTPLGVASQVIWHPLTPPSVHLVYVTPGYWLVNGREWNTTCAAYSTTATRCTATIKATQVKKTTTGYIAVTDWVFNNLTYTDQAGPAWATNPLAVTGTFTSGGRLWSTSCSPNTTSGSRTCRTYIWATVYGRTALPTGSYAYWQRNQWVFNNMVVLS